jgi:UDP-N-acetylglucosamine 2-epimerase
MNFREAKKKANKIGGVVIDSNVVVKSKDFNDSSETAKYISKKAQIFFLKRHRKNMLAGRKRLRAFIKEYKRQLKEKSSETAKKELDNISEPHTIVTL